MVNANKEFMSGQRTESIRRQTRSRTFQTELRQHQGQHQESPLKLGFPGTALNFIHSKFFQNYRVRSNSCTILQTLDGSKSEAFLTCGTF